MALCRATHSRVDTTVTRPAPSLTAQRHGPRRWLLLLVVAVVCAPSPGVVAAAAHADARPPVAAAALIERTSGDLAGGQWSNLPTPHGDEAVWHLAAWTGRYVIAWGSTAGCCESDANGRAHGRSQLGAAYDLARRTWWRLPAAPVDFAVESTVWDGHEILAWGSTSAGDRVTGNVLLEFDTARWQWKQLAMPPIAPRADAEVVWTGSDLVVVGASLGEPPVSLAGARYDVATDRWKALPTVPSFAAAGWSSAQPIGVTAAAVSGTVYLWVARELSRACGPGCGEISSRVQALQLASHATRWTAAPGPPVPVSAYGATAVVVGRSVALVGGTTCLPGMSCPFGGGGGAPGLFRVATGRWSSIPTHVSLSRGGTVGTGSELLSVNRYLTDDGHQVGGFAGRFDPATGSWTTLPPLPVPRAQPSGPVLTGVVWTGSQLIDGGLALTAGHRRPTAAPHAAPTCPPIPFPAHVNGTFCGPPAGRGNGHGPDGTCLGNETGPPCGPGMVPDRYYAYTLTRTCRNDFIDGRWWRDQLHGGAGRIHVWMAIDDDTTSAQWISPLGLDRFQPTTAASCP